MKLGIIGLGIVGSAIKFGFELIGHNVSFYDIKFNSKIEDVLDTEICFICVPTPSNELGDCDISIVKQVVADLVRYNYNGVICIKSTVKPGTTDYFKSLHTFFLGDFCMVPEFLRERCAISDFTENHDVCIIGCYEDNTFNLLKKAHGDLPKKFCRIMPKEAEFVKYFNNCYNATLITFANCFHDICEKEKVNYANIVRAISNREHISKNYLQCNQSFRGFGGVCLPKDLKALNAMSKGTEISFFQNILDQNDKFRIIVQEGMREQ